MARAVWTISGERRESPRGRACVLSGAKGGSARGEMRERSGGEFVQQAT
jgi:hypothetical protein